MKKIYTKIRQIVVSIRKRLEKIIGEQLEKPTPQNRIVVSFLQTSSITERCKAYRFIDTMKRLGCIVETEDSDLQSANGNTYAIASMYIDGAVAWKVRLGRSVVQNEVSKIIL